MELAPEKQQLHAQQRHERVELLAALDQLQATHRKELEEYRGQARKKALTQEITRDRRYHEEKSVWEYLNNIAEVIHLYSVCEKTPFFFEPVPEYFPQPSLQCPLSCSRTSFLIPIGGRS